MRMLLHLQFMLLWSYVKEVSFLIGMGKMGHFIDEKDAKLANYN